VTTYQDRNHKGSILVIDDEPASLKVLLTILTENGYVVHPANEGELGLQFARHTPVSGGGRGSHFGGATGTSPLKPCGGDWRRSGLTVDSGQGNTGGAFSEGTRTNQKEGQ
jgi:CheY-like chemotaxis protein